MENLWDEGMDANINIQVFAEPPKQKLFENESANELAAQDLKQAEYSVYFILIITYLTDSLNFPLFYWNLRFSL